MDSLEDSVISVASGTLGGLSTSKRLPAKNAAGGGEGGSHLFATPPRYPRLITVRQVPGSIRATGVYAIRRLGRFFRRFAFLRGRGPPLLPCTRSAWPGGVYLWMGSGQLVDLRRFLRRDT